MSSTSRTMSCMNQYAGVANAWVEAVGTSVIGLEACHTRNPLASSDPNFDHFAPYLFDWFAYYAIVKGVLQIAEGVGIAAGNEKNHKIGAIQIMGGVLSAAAGIFYELAGTSALQILGLGLGINAVVRLFSLLGKAFGSLNNWELNQDQLDRQLHRAALEEASEKRLDQLKEKLKGPRYTDEEIHQLLKIEVAIKKAAIREALAQKVVAESKQMVNEDQSVDEMTTEEEFKDVANKWLDEYEANLRRSKYSEEEIEKIFKKASLDEQKKINEDNSEVKKIPDGFVKTLLTYDFALCKSAVIPSELTFETLCSFALICGFLTLSSDSMGFFPLTLAAKGLSFFVPAIQKTVGLNQNIENIKRAELNAS